MGRASRAGGDRAARASASYVQWCAGVYDIEMSEAGGGLKTKRDSGKGTSAYDRLPTMSRRRAQEVEGPHGCRPRDWIAKAVTCMSYW